MIVVDASALVAIMQDEPEGPSFLAAIKAEERVAASTITVLEAGMVMRARRGEQGRSNLSAFLMHARIEVVPFDAVQVELALTAFTRYGKGIHPQARLNLGDCASYALAKALNAPLLYKGGDFAATDVATVI
jgi:ribonuclease VapC